MMYILQKKTSTGFWVNVDTFDEREEAEAARKTLLDDARRRKIAVEYRIIER